MKIVADENIVFAREFFAHAGKQSAKQSDNELGTQTNQLLLKAGRDICHTDLVDADALLVRSVTPVNADLLDNTNVKFVGTATIGTDHIDREYLQKNGIAFADAAGCSADTVAQYVITAIHALRAHYVQENITLGIIGYGNIGQALARVARALGWQCLVYDPFVQVTDDECVQAASFETVLQQSDVISLHVPLTYAGQSEFPTYHLINTDSLSQMPTETLLINSARGKVICEADLLDNIAQTQRQVVLDVFEHEPVLSDKLLASLALATPHIAGYSLEGKARGTQFIYDAFCRWQASKPSVRFEPLLPILPALTTSTATEDSGKNDKSSSACHLDQLNIQLATLYDIHADDAALRQSITQADPAQQFDQLRKGYALRREWQAYGLTYGL